MVPSVSLEALGNSLAHLIHPHNEQDRSDEAEGMVQNIPSRCEEIIDGNDTSDALRNTAHLVGDAAVFGVEVVNATTLVFAEARRSAMEMYRTPSR